MNKKIKIIELVNRKAENKSMAKWIRVYYGKVYDDYKYDEELKWYITLDDTTVLNAIDKLNMEVEILEDNTEEIEEIEELPKMNFFELVTDEVKTAMAMEKIKLKVDELVKAIKEIRKDLNK